MAENGAGAPPRDGLTVAGNVFEIIEKMVRVDDVGVTELAESLGLPKSTVHGYLKTLEEYGYAINEGGRYRISLKLLELAGEIRNHKTLFRVAKDHINALARTTGEVAVLGVEEQGKAVMVYPSEGENATWDDHPVGDRTPMHVTALGKAMLAEFPEHRVREIIDRHGLEPKTEESIVDEDDLFEDLAQTRERGHSFQGDEHEMGIAAYGMPIRRNDGSVIGSVAVAGPTARLSDPATRDRIIEAMSESINVIEIEYEHRIS